MIEVIKITGMDGEELFRSPEFQEYLKRSEEDDSESDFSDIFHKRLLEVSEESCQETVHLINSMRGSATLKDNLYKCSESIRYGFNYLNAANEWLKEAIVDLERGD